MSVRHVPCCRPYPGLQQRDSGCYHSHASRNKPESEHRKTAVYSDQQSRNENGHRHRRPAIDVTPEGQPQTSSSTMGAIHEDNKKFLTVAAIGVGIVFRSHETMAPIIPGSAAATFPSRAFSQPAGVFSCFFTHSDAPCSEGVVGLGAGIIPPHRACSGLPTQQLR